MLKTDQEEKRHFDDHGAQLALSYIEYPNPPGKANLEPQVLSDSVVRVIRDCVQALPARDAVAAITVSSFGESFVPIDEHGALQILGKVFGVFRFFS